MKDIERAVTHNGKFHADEIFATAVLEKLYPTMKLVRSRDDEVVKSADIVYDVGGIYDHDSRRYDHHQNGARKREDGLTYSAFGLIWLHYGEQYCGGDKEVWELIDRRLVRGIDAGDNGENRTVPDARADEFGISQVIELLNPLPERFDEDADTQFSVAVGQASLLLSRLEERCRAELNSAQEVAHAREASPDARYVIVDHVVLMTDCIAEMSGLEFVVFPDTSNQTWQVYAVPLPGQPFVQKHPFPQEWAGRRTEDLAEVTGVDDAIFCHAKRFLAVAKTREGAELLLSKVL